MDGVKFFVMVDGQIMTEKQGLMACIAWMLEHCDYYAANKSGEQWIYRENLKYAHIMRVEEYD
jgi:hypothetical protein